MKDLSEIQWQDLSARLNSAHSLEEVSQAVSDAWELAELTQPALPTGLLKTSLGLKLSAAEAGCPHLARFASLAERMEGRLGCRTLDSRRQLAQAWLKANALHHRN